MPQPTAIIGAIPQKVAILQYVLTDITMTEVAGTMIFQGVLNGVSVVVLQCGISKVTAYLVITTI